MSLVPTADRDFEWAELLRLWAGFWRFKPSPDEVATLAEAVATWTSLAPLLTAMRHATETQEDRPAVGWLMAEARKRQPERTTSTKMACGECRGALWKDDAKGGGLPMLRPCPECRPLQAELHAAGCYALDASPASGKGEGNPTAQAIIDRHRAEGPRKGKEVMVAREPAMTEQTREYWTRHAIASEQAGGARADVREYLLRLARGHRVPAPQRWDEEAIPALVAALERTGAEVDHEAVAVPTPEQILQGATIKRPPGTTLERSSLLTTQIRHRLRSNPNP